MSSTLKTTLLAATAVLLAALGGAQAAQAGGYGHRHFDSYLLDGLHDEEDTYTSAYDTDTDDAVSTATGIARDVLGVDVDDVLESDDD